MLSVPFALRYLFATDPAVMGQVLGIVYSAIPSHLIKAAGYHHTTVQTGAVTLFQRFGSALNLNIQTHYRGGQTNRQTPAPIDSRSARGRLLPLAQF